MKEILAQMLRIMRVPHRMLVVLLDSGMVEQLMRAPNLVPMMVPHLALNCHTLYSFCLRNFFWTLGILLVALTLRWMVLKVALGSFSS
jgi:hypothetical protein